MFTLYNNEEQIFENKVLARTFLITLLKEMNYIKIYDRFYEKDIDIVFHVIDIIKLLVRIMTHTNTFSFN